MKTKIKMMELAGLFLILLSFFIQVFILTPSQNITNDAVRYKIEQKIDILYNIVRDNYQKLHPEVKEPYFIANPKSFDNFKYAEQDSEIMHTAKQTKSFHILVAIIFIIGSLALICAKCFEYQETKTSNKALAADS